MNKSDDIKAITQVIQDWHTGWQNSDVESLLSLFIEAPVLLPQGQPAISGKETIRAVYQDFFASYTVTGECHVHEIEVSGGLGYIWVSYTLTASPKGEGEVINEDSKTLFIVRRQDDNHWKIARLMDNSDR